MVWTNKSTGESFSISGNDKSAYAKAAAQIQTALNQGHEIDRSGQDILEKAEYIKVYHPER